MLEKEIFIPLLDCKLKEKKGALTYLGKSLSICEMSFGNVLLYNQYSEATSTPAHYASANKSITKSLLASCNIPTPEGKLFNYTDYIDALRYFKQRNRPCAVKPNNLSRNKGVSLSVRSVPQFKNAWRKAVALTQEVMVEDMLIGTEFRIYVVDGTVRAATTRAKPFVVGDGVTSIRELIDEKNKKRCACSYTVNKLITISDSLLENLKFNQLNLTSIASKGQVIILGDDESTYSGGEHYEVTDKIHPGFHAYFRVVFDAHPSLRQVGLDVIVEDIGASPKSQLWGVLESNVSANILPHHYPVKGNSIDLLGQVLDDAFSFKRRQLGSKLNSHNKILSPLSFSRQHHSTKSKNSQELIQRAIRSSGGDCVQLDNNLWFAQQNDAKRYFVQQMSEQTSYIAYRLFNDRFLTNVYLSKLNVPVPILKVFSINQIEDAWDFARQSKSFNVKQVIRQSSKDGLECLSKKSELIQFGSDILGDEFVVEQMSFAEKITLLVISNTTYVALKTALQDSAEAEDITDSIHRSIVDKISEIKRILPMMFVAEFTLYCRDFLSPYTEEECCFAEINANPDITKYQYLTSVHGAGVSRDVAGAFAALV